MPIDLSKQSQVSQVRNELNLTISMIQQVSDRLKSRGLFPKQEAFADDRSPFKAALCTRRAGKSWGAANILIDAALDNRNSLSPYIALTRLSAKNIMWPTLKRVAEKRGIKGETVESELLFRLPNGSAVQLFGANTEGFIDRLRGGSYPIAVIDEAQSFRSHLSILIDDVLSPAMLDYNGAICLLGTPGPVMRGYFYEATKSMHGFSVHKWSVLDNIYLPHAENYIQDLMARKQWTKDNPTFRREWLGEWVEDLDSLLIKYSKEKNDYTDLPRGNWFYIMGIDLGFEDADAIAILAFCDTDPCTYLVEERVIHKQGLTELVVQINELRDKYVISHMVIDEGGLGKKLAEELRRRHSVPVKAAEKSRKMETIEFLNDTLRTGRFKAKANSQFAQDAFMVEIDWDKTTPDKIKVSDKFHSDIIDAVLYAFKESPAYAYQKVPDKPQPGTEEYSAMQAKELLEHHIAKLERERQNKDNQMYGTWNVDQNMAPEWTKWSD